MGQHVGSMRTSAWTLLAAVIAVCVAICAADLAATSDEVAFLQTQQEMGTVRGHCEICIAVMQAKERGEPHLFASFRHPTYYTTSSRSSRPCCAPTAPWSTGSRTAASTTTRLRAPSL